MHRFNKIAIKGKGPDGKWTRKPLAYRESITFHLCIIRPPEICVNLVFKRVLSFLRYGLHACIHYLVDNVNIHEPLSNSDHNHIHFYIKVKNVQEKLPQR